MKNSDQMPSIKSSFPPCALVFLRGILTFDGKKQRKGKKKKRHLRLITMNQHQMLAKNSGWQHRRKSIFFSPSI